MNSAFPCHSTPFPGAPRGRLSRRRYGFVAIGRWTVDHGNRRERTDSGNLTMEPRTTVADYSVRAASDATWAYDDGRDLCCFQQASGRQAAWAVDAAAELLPTSTEDMEVWRTIDADQQVCVDFSVPLISGDRAALPELIQYWGACTDGSEAHPDAEVLDQTNSYPREFWDLSTPAAALFVAPSGCTTCAVRRAAAKDLKLRGRWPLDRTVIVPHVSRRGNRTDATLP